MQDDIKDFDQPTLSEDLELVRLEPTPLAFHKEVWDKLSRIDIGDHIEVVESGSFKFKYLSWSWAWATLMKHYPASEFVILEEERFDDGTVNVRVVVTIRSVGGQAMDRFSWLPVMDRRNNAIQNPSARDINDARMRCLVKALAFCGLGLDIWAGSDIPVGATEDPIGPEQLDLINGLIEKAEPDMVRFLKWLKVDTVEEIPLSKFKQTVAELERSLKRKSQS